MKELHRLIDIITTLRGPNGCPWDKEQDLRSMRSYLLEEVYEALEAMDKAYQPNADDDLLEELGDLLFVVLLLCRICEEEERFGLDAICKRIADKMVVRHPHVFSSHMRNVQTATESLAVWEKQKAKSKPRKSRLDGVPKILPSLLRAHRQGEKAAVVGFDWPTHHGVLEKIEEELEELKEAIHAGQSKEIAHEYGDFLLAMANLGRHLHIAPEDALREANDRFGARFRHMERQAKAKDITLSTLDASTLESMWEVAKSALSTKSTQG